MAIDKKGGFTEVPGQPYAMQTDRTINEKNDGTLEGTVAYVGDAEDVDAFPQFGDLHPDDDRLEIYNISKIYMGLELLKMTASYFGLASSSGGTDANGRVVSLSGGQNQEPITTHPDFEEFAGTPDNPNLENGALFDKITGEFIGFDTFSNVAGVEYYLTPSTLISVSYWTDKEPTLKPRMKIVNKIKGVKTPPDVKNFLRTDTTYRQTGSSYQVTEQYLGSGEDGWNKLIYPD
jgi:hypothetical protein